MDGVWTGGGGRRCWWERAVCPRQTDGGEVERATGAFEALTVTRTSRGVCRHQQCNDVTEADTTGAGACPNVNCANRFNPLATKARGDLPSVNARERAATDAAVAAAAPSGGGGGAAAAAAASRVSVSAVTYTGKDR